MTALARLVTRRKGWVIAFWVLGALALGTLGSGLGDKTQDDFASFLPEDAEATEVQTLLKERFPGGETSTGLIVYHRDEGVTDMDRYAYVAGSEPQVDLFVDHI